MGEDSILDRGYSLVVPVFQLFGFAFVENNRFTVIFSVKHLFTTNYNEDEKLVYVFQNIQVFNTHKTLYI